MKLDPKDTAGIERAAALVYEAVTGECWHKWGGHAQGFRIINFSKCEKCGIDYDDNPPLAISLDAWRPLWDAMSDYQQEHHTVTLRRLHTHDERDWYWYLTPLHHLEAALRALGLVEKWEAGE